MAYPHFIGTIQEFVHRFLALPYIRSSGIQNIIVDNDEYVKQAIDILSLDQFGWLRGTFKGLGNDEALEAFFRGTFRYTSENGKAINIHKKPKAWKSNDENLIKAKRNLEVLKQYLDQRGCFLFRDMYTHAHEACTNNTNLGEALRERFPYVLIDEMQDTQKFQDELLCEIFPTDGKTIVQRFGDPDQSIFHGVGSEKPNQSFNGKSRSDMDFIIHKSHRFDSALSSRIKCFSFNEISLETELSEKALADRTKAHSDGGRFEHTIIVFNDETQNRVVEYFAEIVSNQFSTEYKEAKNFTVKVVGAVGKEIDPNSKQLRIGHYWPSYDKTKSKTSYRETCFIDAVRHCQSDSSVDWSVKYRLLVTCILKLMRMSKKKDDAGMYFSAATLRVVLIKNQSWERFRKGMFYLLNDSRATEYIFWDRVCEKFVNLLGLEKLPKEATEYITFTEQIVLKTEENTKANNGTSVLTSMKNNRIAHPDGFNLDLSTIHGVKGETHDATLIIETKNHTFDLEKMLPFLTGKLPNVDCPINELADKPNSRRANKIFMRQLYVAMSRPKHLLCLAIHSDHIVEEDKRMLREREWQIETIHSLKEIVG